MKKTEKSVEYGTMKTIFDAAGCDLHEKKGARFTYPFYCKPSMMDMPIEALELKVRASNGLKRAGFWTVGQLVEGLANGADLKRVRGLGAQTYAEIMEQIFLLNLLNMPEQKRADYIRDLISRNEKEY